MKIAIVLSALVAVSFAASVNKRIVCTPELCGTPKVMDCPGKTYKTGFCGCTELCAKQKGEACEIHYSSSNGIGIFGFGGITPVENNKCEEGLHCTNINLEGHSSSVCTDPTEDTDDVLMSKRQEYVCPPNYCSTVKQEDLNCKGGLLKGTGTCGCTDSCAKVRGERCIPMDSPFLLMDVANTETCDEDLVCHKAYEGSAICLMPNETSTFVSKRSTPCDTACRKKSQMCTFSFVIYPGQWFARCDTEGNFLAQQCNNKGECFCVDQEGTIDESTRVLGSAQCA